MTFSEEQKVGLNTAFNEAAIIGAEFDPATRRLGLTLGVVSVNPDGTVPDDRRVVVILSPIGRLWASLRNSRWDDDAAKAVTLTADQLLETVQSFQAQSIYGWEFFDCDDSSTDRWKNRLSLNYENGTDGLKHTLDLFQDGGNRILDLRVWFDDIAFFTPSYQPLAIEDFIAAGNRAWDAITHDKNIQDTFGIYPLAPGYSD